ncbi:MAG: response regulator [Stellaceae bacterium]
MEDDVLIRALLAARLRMDGVRVIEAADADEAWSYLQAGGVVNLLFSDVRMAGSMDGIELGRRVRAVHRGVRVVLTSGAPPAGSGVDPDSFIRKPYDFPQLVAQLRRALGLTDKGS